MSCQHEELTWADCQKDGHEEGCFVSECVSCLLVVPDCENDSPSCSVCYAELDARLGESYYLNARCDDCNFDLAIARGEK